MHTPSSLWWNVEIEGMPDFDMSMRRVYAWFENEIIDRPPVRFQAHNAFLYRGADLGAMSAEQRKKWWFDTDLQLENYLLSIANRRFHGETFPVFWPNLGPDVYAAFYGAELIYGDVTSWSIPLVRTWDEIDRVQLNLQGEYFLKLEEMTRAALEVCKGKSLVGYTDLHPSLDCVAAWRDPQQLCFDMLEEPDMVKVLTEKAIADFHFIYDHFDRMLKAGGQPSVTWMGIPTFERMHVPSSDFSNLISPAMYREFGLPLLQREVVPMSHNVFHVDGKRVARHLDAILSVPQVHAIQWVQGVGDDQPIMQWVPQIKELQARGLPVIVDLTKYELDDFMEVMSPKGMFLWIATESEDEEITLLKHISKWK